MLYLNNPVTNPFDISFFSSFYCAEDKKVLIFTTRYHNAMFKKYNKFMIHHFPPTN